MPKAQHSLCSFVTSHQNGYKRSELIFDVEAIVIIVYYANMAAKQIL